GAETSKGGVRALAIVESEPAVEEVATLLFAREVLLETFTLHGPDEAFGTPVGPRVVRLGARPAHADRRTGLREPALVSSAVVREHAPHADAACIEVGDRVAHEGRAVERAQAGAHLDVGEAAGRVDRDVQVVVPDAQVVSGRGTAGADGIVPCAAGE